MVLFHSSERKDSDRRILEETMYQQVVDEVSRGEIRSGLWAKAMADSLGDESKAKSLYIKHRVQSLKDEMFLVREKAKDAQKIKKQKNRQREIETAKHLQQQYRKKQHEKKLPFQRLFWFASALIFSILFLAFLSVLFLSMYDGTISSDENSPLTISALFTAALFLWGAMTFFRWSKEASKELSQVETSNEK